MTTIKTGNSSGESMQMVAKQACTVVYDRLPPLDGASLCESLEPTLGLGSVEWAKASTPTVPMVAGVAQFGPHRIVMIALDAPVKQEVLDRTVGVSPMPEEARASMMAHRAAIRVLYVGDAEEPIAQLTAMYHVAGALLTQGGLGVLNERAALAQPAELMESLLAQLDSETPPLPVWVGVVTFRSDEASGHAAYLMRTYGMEQMRLPELGIRIRDRSKADAMYHILLNICLYIVENNSKLAIGPGDRADFLGHTYLFVEPDEHDTAAEYHSPTGLLLLVEV